MIAPFCIRSVARVCVRAVGVLALSSLAACSWVDDTGLQEGDQTEPQLDAVNLVQEGQTVPFSLLTLDPNGVVSDVSLSLVAEGDLSGACSAQFTALDAADSLRAACQPSLSDTQCAAGVDVSGSSVLVSLPELRYPVGLRYQIAYLDSAQSAASTTFDLCVQSVSSPPSGVDDTFSVAYGQTLQTTATVWGERCQVLGGSGVLMNDTDDFDYSEVTDSGPACLSAELLAGPQFASDFRLDADGGFRYTNDGSLGPGGVDEFTYQVNDGRNTSGPVSVQLQVVGENLPPVASGVGITSLEDTVLTVQVDELGTDPEGLPLRLSAVSAAGQGTAEIRAGALRFEPPEGFSGTARVFFSIVDMAGAESAGLVAIAIQPVNDAPSFENAPTGIVIDAASEAARNVMLTVLDDETVETRLSLSASIDPSIASVSVGSPDADGQVLITISPLANGEATLTLTLRDQRFAGLDAQSTTVDVALEVSGM